MSRIGKRPIPIPSGVQVQVKGNVVHVKGKALRPGDIVRAKVTGADGYDLMARSVGPTR